MPTYELVLVMRHLPKPDLVTSLSRACRYLTGQGGLLRRVESLGDRQLPQPADVHGQVHDRATYFIVEADLPIHSMEAVAGDLKRDRDVLKKDFLRVRPPSEPTCTLEDEMKKPSDRPSVQQMIKIGRKAPKYKVFWEPNTGLDYYPFKR